MKKGAMVENGFIVNVVDFMDDVLVDGYLDITETVGAGIGHPIVDGVPVTPPTGNHTLNGNEWIITEEKQIEIDEQATENSRIAGLNAEKETAGLSKMTAGQRKTFIDDTFDDATTVAQLKAAMKTFAKNILSHII